MGIMTSQYSSRVYGECSRCKRDIYQKDRIYTPKPPKPSKTDDAPSGTVADAPSTTPVADASNPEGDAKTGHAWSSGWYGYGYYGYRKEIICHLCKSLDDLEKNARYVNNEISTLHRSQARFRYDQDLSDKIMKHENSIDKILRNEDESRRLVRSMEKGMIERDHTIIELRTELLGSRERIMILEQKMQTLSKAMLKMSMKPINITVKQMDDKVWHISVYKIDHVRDIKDMIKQMGGSVDFLVKNTSGDFVALDDATIIEGVGLEDGDELYGVTQQFSSSSDDDSSDHPDVDPQRIDDHMPVIPEGFDASFDHRPIIPEDFDASRNRPHFGDDMRLEDGPKMTVWDLIQNKDEDISDVD